MTDSFPWQQGCGFPPEVGKETDKRYALFRQWLKIGPGRTMTDLQLLTGWKASTCSQKASLFHWRDRAQAYDRWMKDQGGFLVSAVTELQSGAPEQAASIICPEVIAEFRRRAKAYQAEYEAKLRDYRDRMEELGRMQTSAARDLMESALTGLSQHHQLSELSEAELKEASKPYFELVRITDMLRTANTLSGLGADLEAKALGVDQLMIQIHALAQVDDWLNRPGDVTEAEILELLPPEANC